MFALLRRDRRHGQRLAATAFEGVIRVVAGDAQLPFRLLVVGLEVVIGDGPVGERGALRHAVLRGHAEVVGVVAPGHRTVAQRAAANAGGVVRVAGLGRRDDARCAVEIDHHARVALVIGAESVAQSRIALVAQIVLAAIPGRVPRAALEQHHAPTGGGELAGHDGTGGAGSDDDGIGHRQAHQLCPPCDAGSKMEYWRRPRTGTIGTPSMRQLA